MFPISSDARNRATIFSPNVWGPQAKCCTSLTPGQQEFQLHSQFSFKEFQHKSNQFFQGKPTFPEHGECCSDFGGGPFE